MKFIKLLILDIFSRLFNKDKCDHKCDHEYQTITNLYGKEVLNVGFRKYKSIKECKHCGNVVYSTKRDKNCNVANKKFRIYK